MARGTKKKATKKRVNAAGKVRKKQVKRAAAVKQLAKNGGTPRAKAKKRVRKVGATGDDWR